MSTAGGKKTIEIDGEPREAHEQGELGDDELDAVVGGTKGVDGFVIKAAPGPTGHAPATNPDSPVTKPFQKPIPS